MTGSPEKTWFQGFDVGLARGNNTITVHALDRVGIETTAALAYVHDYTNDPTPPAITLYWPRDNAVLCGGTFMLRGSLGDPTASVTVTGVTDGPVEGIAKRGQFWVENLS